MNYYIAALKQYAVFAGRDTRKQFWMFFLVHVLIIGVLSIVDGALAGPEADSFGVLSSLYSLVTLVPYLAIGVRRLHDTGRSGWNLLWTLLPFFGSIVLIVFWAQRGEAGANKYDAAPSDIMTPPSVPPVPTPTEPPQS